MVKVIQYLLFACIVLRDGPFKPGRKNQAFGYPSPSMSNLLHSSRIPNSGHMVSKYVYRTLTISSVLCDLFGRLKTNNAKQVSNSGPSKASSNPTNLFKQNNVLMYSEKPVNYIESVRFNGFHLNSNIMISSPDKNGNTIGALLMEKEALEVDFTNSYTISNGYIVDFDVNKVLGIFQKIHPKPEILVVGLGKKSRILSQRNRAFFSSLGIQLEIGDSKNAASSFDVLATERPNVVGALLLPPNV